MESNFMDEIDCGNFFDQIDDFIDFPPENECVGGNTVSSGDCRDVPSMWNDMAPDFDIYFPGSRAAAVAADLSAELFVPYEDIVQLEWLSTIVDDSLSDEGVTIGNENSTVKKETSRSRYQSSSPVSVLESSSSSSSSSCSRGKTMPCSPNHGRTPRARSKRSRPAAFTPKTAIQLVLPSSSSVETPKPFVTPTGPFAEADSFAESPLMATKPAGLEQKKRKKMKYMLSANPLEMHPNHLPLQSVRKCLHCEITKTPQWRAGPMGPKTLCNACGVRFKSGRLFPEYRPAASPTFVPSLHSNSHKKVVEMRSKPDPRSAANAPISAKSEPIQSCTPS